MKINKIQIEPRKDMTKQKTDTRSNVQELKECVSYHGPAKTTHKMDNAIALGAAQDFFAKLAPADVILSEELIRERREEAKRE